MEQSRCAVVGDNFTGKTCLLFKIKDPEFNLEDALHVPIFEQFQKETSEGPSKKINFIDTTSIEDHFFVRSSIYKNVHVILLCYAINDIISFKNLTNWLAEIESVKRFEAHIVLVGTKSDLERHVTFEMGREFQIKYNLAAFVECSAATNTNIKTVVNVIEVLCHTDEKEKCCKIL